MQPPDERRTAESQPLTTAEPQPLTTENFRFQALSWPTRLLVCLTIGVLVTAAGWHLASAFFFVAPSNTVSQQHGQRMWDYMNPEFEQNWKLFAPNPLQVNVHVEARVEVLGDDGRRDVSEWISLSGMDIEDIRHNLVPSHTMHNELRRGWEFFRNTLDEDGRPEGMRGEVAEIYVHRIALLRLSRVMDVHDVARIQLRSASTRVAAPEWSGQETDTTTDYYERDWRTVLPADLPRGALATDPPGDGGTR